MLDVRKKLNYNSGKEGLLIFFQSILMDRHLLKRDIVLLCAHAPEQYHLFADDLIEYCLTFGWILKDGDRFFASSEVLERINDGEKLNDYLIKSSIAALLSQQAINYNMFEYDSIRGGFFLKNQFFPFQLFPVRNTLASQNFFIREKKDALTIFYVNPRYEAFVVEHCKKQKKKLSLKNLIIKLNENNEAGEKAELFVLKFEQKRLAYPLCEKVKRISDIDVMAGYDIVSYNSAVSTKPDRFIEVKAVSKEGFYWSNNEYETAKLLGAKYYLYLVNLSLIHQDDYLPEIINNPAEIIARGENWMMEPQSYRVLRV